MTSVFENLGYFFKGNHHAVALALDLIYLSQLIDDLVDRDVERSVDEVKIGFRKLLVDVPANPFYQKFYSQISTLIASTYLMWLDSTTLEQGNKGELFICFHIRNTTINIIHHFILLTGGPAWAQEVGPQFWKMFAREEIMQDLIDELKLIGDTP